MGGIESCRRDENNRMKVILKYLKPFSFILVMCVALLFGQAISDLSLPNLMSDIVNVGIQQSGIDEHAPEAISENGLELMKLYMNENDKQVIEKSYTLVQPHSVQAKDYEKDYPLIKDEAVYVLTETDKTKLENVEKTYGKSAFAFMKHMQSMATDSDGAIETADSETGFADVDITEIYELLPMLSMMPDEAFSDAIAASESADSMLQTQVGVGFTKLFYTELGTNLNAVQQSYILAKGVLMLLIALGGVAAAVLVGFFASRTAAGVAKQLRHDVFAKVESFSSKEFDQFSTASLITRTTNDVQQIQMLIVMGIRMMCYAPILGIGGIIMAVGKSVSLSWIIAAAVVVLIGLILVIFAVALPKFKILQKLTDRINLVSRENLSGMMEIRAFGNQKHEEDRFEVANRNLRNTERFTQRAMALMMPVMILVMNLVTLVIVWVGGHAIAESTMQIGDMIAFMQYAMQIIMSFLMIAMMFIMVPRASVSAARIAEVLNTEPDIVDPKNQKHLNMDKTKGVIKFNNVSFRYNGAESDVLQNISFTARPGETTAFIGSTGSGKSTLINLIPRFYDVTEGSIEIDGINIKDVSQHELREVIGYIPQKAVLFSGDIESNILYGKEEATAAEIERAMEVAQAKDFVDEMEEGQQTAIAQGGGNVSGGQKQRLAITRALVKKPSIYIFDDSFSALDFKTDAALRKALKEYTSDATVFIVAQRVSTIMNAEQIIVLDAGKIVGKGTHQELIETCPEYREIAESQLAKEELA